jgi:hypothetical protein
MFPNHGLDVSNGDWSDAIRSDVFALRWATMTKTWSLVVARVVHCHTCAAAAWLIVDSMEWTNHAYTRIAAIVRTRHSCPRPLKKTSTDDDVDCCDFVMMMMTASYRRRHDDEEITHMSDWNKIRFSEAFGPCAPTGAGSV